jgi:hypothetical protein
VRFFFGRSVAIEPSLGQQGRFDAAPDVQLLEDVRHVMLDGLLGEIQTLADLSICQAFPEELQDLTLPFGELIERVSWFVVGHFVEDCAG